MQKIFEMEHFKIELMQYGLWQRPTRSIGGWLEISRVPGEFLNTVFAEHNAIVLIVQQDRTQTTTKTRRERNLSGGGEQSEREPIVP